MSYRRTPFAPGEWYHCYTRGVEKMTTFKSRQDYERFTEALYICNGIKNINRGDFKKLIHTEILTFPRPAPLVAIGAYCLMPNHFHLLLKEMVEGGLSKFMQRVGTSYSMHFNIKYDHSGGVFVGPFRSKHIDNDQYLRKIVPYIHLNPVEIFEPGWKTGKVRNYHAIEKRLREYAHSSLPSYIDNTRPENTLLDQKEIGSLLEVVMPPLKKLIPEALEYYTSLA